MKKKTKQSAINQLNEDLGVSARAFSCPKCGASLIIDQSRVQSFCQFCGAPLPKVEELIKLSYDYMEKNKDREIELKRLRHEERKTAAKIRHQRLQDIAGMIGLLFIIGWFIFGAITIAPHHP